ncbi:hypothetical protein [Enterobacter hormaechei]|uniref:hypothetical protein n=1 Tax=Enterobacter cloacae complex TaxID=354276 RepID=UPI00079B64DE|nr:hypothetical protein [Enterobacter hormaechei]SAD04543.1 Uncharacterised protein [Enterobacter hormaechei]VAE12562.1 Uncharacterised protein [Enterobacter hormaechei]VAF53650.1 Uncharacterised protein [Enterobacter hormaechei]
MKIESLFLLALYLIPLISMGIVSHINYKKCRIQFSAISKGIRFQRKYQMLKSLHSDREGL